MARTTKIKASELIVDHALYPRQSIDDQNIKALAEALEAGADLPPIVADRKSKVISDGVHRLRAVQRVGGDDVEVDVELRTYKTQADLFADAVAMNAGHGRKLTGQDHSRIVIRAKQLGIPIQRVAGLLNVPASKLERRTLVGKPTVRRPPTGSAPTAVAIPLKQTMKHFDGRTLTRAQVEANDKAGGMSPVFYVRQVAMLIEADALDLDNKTLVRALVRLRDALDDLDLPDIEEAD